MIGYMPPNCSCGLQAIGRASKVSYNRPFITTTSPVGGAWDFIFGAEYPAIRWLEQNGYDVNYISGVDTARDGAQLLNTKVFLSVGHDEYWSGEQRENVEAARDAGVNLAFWSGNEVYWKIRWETSIDGIGHAVPDDGHLQGDLGAYRHRSERHLDRHLARSALPGSRAGAGELAHRPLFKVDSYAKDTITIPYDYSQAALLAEHRASRTCSRANRRR